MSNIRIGIVEDEMIVAMGIADTLRELGYEPTKPATSYTRALEMIATEKPDLLLLDIQLSGYKDGIDLAAKVNQDFGIPYIFLTANADATTVDRAKQTSPQAYLVKPFRKSDLFAAIELCLHHKAKRSQVQQAPDERNYIVNDALFIKQGALFHKVKLEDILYLESDKIYLHIHTTNTKLLVRSTLQDYLALIDSPALVKVHRSYAINVNHITTINSEYLLIGKVQIPVSKAHREDLLNHFRLG